MDIVEASQRMMVHAQLVSITMVFHKVNGQATNQMAHFPDLKDFMKVLNALNKSQFTIMKQGF